MTVPSGRPRVAAISSWLSPSTWFSTVDDALLERQPAERSIELIAVDDGAALVRDRPIVVAQQHDLGPTPDAAPLVVARVDEEAPQPGLEPGRVAEAGQLAPRSDERLLGGVVGPVGVAEDRARERVHPVDVRVRERRERVVVAGHRARHVRQFGASRFHALNHTTPPRSASLTAERLAERGDVVGREAVVAVEVARLEVDPARIVDVARSCGP